MRRRTGTPSGRRALLVDDIEEREPICHCDPGVAHPDVELALVLLVSVQRELCALGSHPPCVVGFGSHRHNLLLSATPNLYDTPIARGVCSINDSARPIFLSLRADALRN